MGRILKEHGIRYAFGIPTAFVWALETGFYEHGRIRIQMRHQQGAGYTADACARCTRPSGVCFGSAGTRVTDSVSGINSEGRTSETEEGLRQGGISRSNTKKMVLTYDGAIGW